MYAGTSLAGPAVGTVAAFGSVVNLVLGLRAGRCDRTSALPRFAVAFVQLLIAALVFAGIVSPVAAYGMLCLSGVSVFLYDVLRDERARRRRLASLTPRPAVEVIPSVWVVIAAGSVLMLAPYVVLGQQRLAAVMVGICAAVMTGVAWRIASSPVQLKGDDIQIERIRDRAMRCSRAGLSAVQAVGSIFVFVSFVNAGLPAVLPLQRAFLEISLVITLALAAWVLAYWRHLERLSCSTS